jgi:hypothetical protein
MFQASAASNRSRAAAAALPAPVVPPALAQFCRGLYKDLFDPYRPERHYMRGPGPRWHEKHAREPRASAQPLNLSA